MKLLGKVMCEVQNRRYFVRIEEDMAVIEEIEEEEEDQGTDVINLSSDF